MFDCMRDAGSVVKRSDFESVDALAAHLESLLRDPAKYARYFAWKVAAARPTGPSWRLGGAASGHQPSFTWPPPLKEALGCPSRS